MKNPLARELFIIVNKMKRYLDKRYQLRSIPIGQARVLRYLFDNSTNGKIIFQSDLKDAFQLRGASITNMLDFLVKDLYVERIEDKDDKRKKQIILTEKGQQKAKEVKEVTLEFEKDLRSSFSDEEFSVIEKTLYRLENWIDNKEKEDNV